MDTLWPRLRTAAALLFAALLTVMWLQPGTRAVDLPLDNLPIRLQDGGSPDTAWLDGHPGVILVWLPG